MKTNYLTHTKKKLSFKFVSYFFISIKSTRKVGNKMKKALLLYSWS